jgi:hypothetical protein
MTSTCIDVISLCLINEIRDGVVDVDPRRLIDEERSQD